MKKFISLMSAFVLMLSSSALAFANQGSIDLDPVELTIHGGGSYVDGSAIVMSFSNSSGEKVALPDNWSVDIYGFLLFAPPVASTADGTVEQLNDERFYIAPNLETGNYIAFLRINGETVDSERFEVTPNFALFNLDNVVSSDELNFNEGDLFDVVIPEVDVEFDLKPGIVDLSKYEYYEGEEATLYFSGSVNGEIFATDLNADYYALVHGVDGPGGEFLYLSSADGTLAKDGEPTGVYTFEVGNETAYNFRTTLFSVDSGELSQISFDLLEMPENREFFISTYETEFETGEEVEVGVSIDNGSRNLDFSIGENYEMKLYRRASNELLSFVGEYSDGFFTRDYTRDGKYFFTVPEQTGEYSLRLYENGERVSMWEFDVKEAEQGAVLDPDDIIVDNDNDLVANGNGGGGGIFIPEIEVTPDLGPIFIPDFDNDDDESVRCADLTDGHWVTRMLNSLLDDNLFPIRMSLEDEVVCRVDTELDRKSATAWLLNVYRPELINDLENFNYDYSESPFEDVTGDDPYDPYIIIAAQAGIVNGYPDGTFKPDNTVNRAEWLKILMRTKNLYLATEAEFTLLSENYPEFRPALRYDDVSNDDREQYWYGYLYTASSMYHAGEDTYLIQGREEGGLRNAAMGDPVLYGEAAKLVFLTETMNSLFE